jgi:hypothetical protein
MSADRMGKVPIYAMSQLHYYRHSEQTGRNRMLLTWPTNRELATESAHARILDQLGCISRSSGLSTTLICPWHRHDSVVGPLRTLPLSFG